MVYLPPHFAVTDVNGLHEIIRAAPLGALVTLGADGLTANHLPFVFDEKAGEHGRLLTHVARKNPVWHDHDANAQALVIFNAGEAYISPNWYETKADTHRVVPTWNYAIVHVYGQILVHDDLQWVRGQAGMVTKQQERSEPEPWKMADAPREFIDENLAQIIGLEILIRRMTGKVKASQNRVEADRNGAIAGLRRRNAPGDAVMAEIMETANR